jgi:hypothetical protein
MIISFIMVDMLYYIRAASKAIISIKNRNFVLGIIIP